MLADIRNFSGVRFVLLHRHDSALRDKGLGDDKRVSATAAFVKFFQIDVALEVLNGENARDKSTFFGRGRCEQLLMSHRPHPKGFYRSDDDFLVNLSDRYNLPPGDEGVEFLPKAWKGAT